MRGRFALAAEIVRGLDQAHAENLLPHAVDGHTGGERMLLGEEPLRETEAVARQGGSHRRQDRGRAGFHPVALLVVGAAVEDVGERLLSGALVHHQGNGAAAGDLAKVEIEAVLLRREFPVGLPGTREEPVEQVPARGGREVAGGLGEGRAGIRPGAEQAGFGFGEHAVVEAEIGYAAAGEGTPEDERLVGFDGAVQMRVARAQALHGHGAAVEVEHQAGLVARAVIGGGEVVPTAGLQQTGVADFDGGATVSDEAEADLPSGGVGRPSAVALVGVLLARDGVALVLLLVFLGIPETDADGEGLLGVGLGGFGERVAFGFLELEGLGKVGGKRIFGVRERLRLGLGAPLTEPLFEGPGSG